MIFFDTPICKIEKPGRRFVRFKNNEYITYLDIENAHWICFMNEFPKRAMNVSYKWVTEEINKALGANSKYSFIEMNDDECKYFDALFAYLTGQ